MAKTEVPEKAVELVEELYNLCLPWREDEIRAEALKDVADRAVQWLKYNVPYSYIPAAIQAESSLRAYILAGEVKE